MDFADDLLIYQYRIRIFTRTHSSHLPIFCCEIITAAAVTTRATKRRNKTKKNLIRTEKAVCGVNNDGGSTTTTTSPSHLRFTNLFASSYVELLFATQFVRYGQIRRSGLPFACANKTHPNDNSYSLDVTHRHSTQHQSNCRVGLRNAAIVISFYF